MSRQMNRAQGWLGSIAGIASFLAGKASLLVLVLACASVAMAQQDLVVAANQGSGSVTGFDRAKGAISFTTGGALAGSGLGAPTEIAIRPHITPYAYVTEQLAGSVAVIDMSAIGTLARTQIPLSYPYPFGLSIHPNGHQAAVGNAEVFSGVFGFAANPEPGNAAITDFNGATFNLVSIVDLDREAEDFIIDVGALGGGGLAPVDVAYSPDGSRLYILNTLTSSVDVVETTTFTRLSTVALPLLATQFALQIAVSYDNAFVYVAAFDFNAAGTGALVGFDVPTQTTFNIPLLAFGGTQANPTDVWFNRASTLAYVADTANNQVQVVSVAAQAVITFVAGTQPTGMSRGCINDEAPNLEQGYVSNPVGDSLAAYNSASNVWGATLGSGTDPVGIAVVAIQRLTADAAGFDQRVRERREERSSGLCFVATASYGKTDEVASLRAFRDLYLMPTAFGRSFVDLYYESSPGVASIISSRDDVRASVRGGLQPAVWMARLVMGSGSALPGALGALLVLAAGVAAGSRLLGRAKRTA